MAGEEKKFNIADVARIARLYLSKEEEKKLEKDLKQILNAFEDMDKVETNCDPSFQPIEIKNVLRRDEVEQSLSTEEVFSNTEHKEKGFFKGPKVI